MVGLLACTLACSEAEQAMSSAAEGAVPANDTPTPAPASTATAPDESEGRPQAEAMDEQGAPTQPEPSGAGESEITPPPTAVESPDGGSVEPAGEAQATPPEDLMPPTHWRMGQTMPTPRSELAATLLDGEAYVAGGYNSFVGFGADFEAYNIAQDSWRSLADLPAPMEHACIAALDGKIYLSCGRLPELFVYTPQSDSWAQLADIPTARWGATAVAHGGSLYVIGGTEPGGMTIQRYDPSTDRWTSQAELDILRDHAVAVVYDDLIYILGGRPGAGEVYGTSVVYDPATDTVQPGPALDEPRSGFGAAKVGPLICAAGGEILVNPYHALDTAGCLDPATQAWTAVDPLPGPIHGVAAVSYEGRMYVFGGAGMAARAAPLAGGVYILEP